MTAGFMTHVTCRLTAKNRDQLRNPTLGSRVWATFTFTLLTYLLTELFLAAKVNFVFSAFSSYFCDSGYRIDDFLSLSRLRQSETRTWL